MLNVTTDFSLYRTESSTSRISVPCSQVDDWARDESCLHLSLSLAAAAAHNMKRISLHSLSTVPLNPRYDNLHSKRSRMNERAFSTFLSGRTAMHPGHCTKTKAHGNSGMACYNFELMITICDLHSLAAWRCSMNDADPRGLYDSTAADTPSSGERRWGLLGDCCT